MLIDTPDLRGRMIVDDLVAIAMQKKGMDPQDAAPAFEVRRRVAMAVFGYNAKGYARRGEKRGGLRLWHVG
jgi:hypothetical protein